MKKILNFLDRYPKRILFICFLVNAIYGASMLFAGNLIWVLNFAVALYALRVLVMYWDEP